jgi:hypothetical protein
MLKIGNRARMCDINHAIDVYLSALSGYLPELSGMTPELSRIVLNCVIDDCYSPFVRRMTKAVVPNFGTIIRNDPDESSCRLTTHRPVGDQWWIRYHESKQVIIGISICINKNGHSSRLSYCKIGTVIDLFEILANDGYLNGTIWNSEHEHLELYKIERSRLEMIEKSVISTFISELLKAAAILNRK